MNITVIGLLLILAVGVFAVLILYIVFAAESEDTGSQGTAS